MATKKPPKKLLEISTAEIRPPVITVGCTHKDCDRQECVVHSGLHEEESKHLDIAVKLVKRWCGQHRVSYYCGDCQNWCSHGCNRCIQLAILTALQGMKL